MNQAQLDNIELRLAAVRGRPWVVTPTGNKRRHVVGPSHCQSGRRSLARAEFEDSIIDSFSACQRCADAFVRACRLVQSNPESARPVRSLLCTECTQRWDEQIARKLAAFEAVAADADECAWLAKAPEDIEALVRSVRSLSAENSKLAERITIEEQRARDAAKRQEAAENELRRIKASLATLREVLNP